MSLVVKNLTKVYGSQKALDGITFSAKEGEILGFLGPNGAGKSTTMKIATGFVSATSGTVEVAGFDVEKQSLESRKHIGYLPEHNPLYLEMYVHEYLIFSGKTYGMTSGQLKTRVPEVIEKCGLSLEQNKKISALSKGYRQRVGLAQALLHDPKVLILDEPTTGLDPNQILEIRKLIKEVSKDKTLIFSTHIMQEVQALCDRVIIINKGRIVADKTLKELAADASERKYVIEFGAPVDSGLLEAIESVTSVVALDELKYEIRTAEGRDIRSQVFKLAAEKELPLVGLQESVGSLEEVFHSLTGKEGVTVS
ncbi:MAG: gliding motility-associated ABC transporter ATP-binding subunit GldA [Cyclobacteriaceae bacterium]